MVGESGEVAMGPRRAVVRLALKAVEIDPDYAAAWALLALGQTLLALGQTLLFFANAAAGEDGLAAAERALALDPDYAEAHAVRAPHLANRGRRDEAFDEIAVALRLAPESFEVNSAAAALSYRERQMADAIRYYQKAMSLMEDDITLAGMLVSCYTATGQEDAKRRAAEAVIARAEKAVVGDPSNTKALAFGVSALGVLGERARAREWIDRALLTDPENMSTRFNCACALSAQLDDGESALDLLEMFFATASRSLLDHALADSDLDPIRGRPRFQAMSKGAEARLAATP